MTESKGRGKERSAARKKTSRPPSAKKTVSKGRTRTSSGNSAASRNGKASTSPAEDPNGVARALAALSKADLRESFRFWSGDSGQAMPTSVATIRSQVLAWMGEPERVARRVASLGRRLSSILDLALAASRYQLPYSQLATAKSLAYLSSYDLEAALAVLVRRGLLVDAVVEAFGDSKTRVLRVPADIGDTVLRRRRSQRQGIYDTFTLRGWLDRVYDDPARSARFSPQRVRELYKMYANEAAAVARIDRLPEGLGDLVRKVILEFGGLLPRGLFDRMETELPHWNGRRWGKILEESLVGTVQRLELGRYGIHHNDETLIVFNEVALAWLRRVAVPGDPDAPHDEAALGVDFTSNLSRFLGFIIDHDVRFTVRGEIFKTTEKRILQELIPNPGRELDRAEVLALLYRFSRHMNLIESTGERTFALTLHGREWEPQDLDTKLRALFEYVLEERELGGEYFHQVRMRRILLKLLKRIETGIWYDIMYLPFLARNNYLCALDDELTVDEYFQTRLAGGHHVPMEDLQRMAWNLVGWVRKRLYLLGIVDLGYDRSGHPVALRLTRIGARLLGMSEVDEARPAIGSLVVTPDFEVVLFPTADDSELIHDLDRFCEREREGHTRHFRVSERTVKRALSEGMTLVRICQTLELNARTPVPQNVMYSIKSWASQAGLLFLTRDLRVRGEDPDRIRRFAHDPGVRTYVKKILSEHEVQLKSGVSVSRMHSLLRALDYLIELE